MVGHGQVECPFAKLYLIFLDHSFNYFNVMTTGMASREIHWPKAVNCWLPQANYILSSLGITSDYEDYRKSWCMI